MDGEASVCLHPCETASWMGPAAASPPASYMAAWVCTVLGACGLPLDPGEAATILR